MIYDLQKADVWKRASAALLDFILALIIAVGAIFLLSYVTGLHSHYESYETIMNSYEEKHGVDFDAVADSEAFNALPKDQQDKLNEAFADFAADENANFHYNLMIQLIIVNFTIGILISVAVIEFLIPMILKNGQTVGKKVFCLGVMRVDGVRVNGQIMFIRAILGKYTVETMIPFMMLLWIFLGKAGLLSLMIIALVLIGNIAMMLATRTNSAIHDMLANTVTVDMASQMIFDSPEALLEYKQRVHAEAVERAEYR
jgi:uncharacterized RDD family membrane protein YckC